MARPKLADKKRKTHMIWMRVTHDQMKSFARTAAKHGLATSAWLRTLAIHAAGDK